MVAGKKKPLHLEDKFGNEIGPDVHRLKTTGDVFIGWPERDPLPPQGAEVTVTLRGIIAGGVSLKEVKDEDESLWVATVNLRLASKDGAISVLAEPPVAGGLPFGKAKRASVTITKDSAARMRKNAAAAKKKGRPKVATR